MDRLFIDCEREFDFPVADVFRPTRNPNSLPSGLARAAWPSTAGFLNGRVLERQGTTAVGRLPRDGELPPSYFP